MAFEELAVKTISEWLESRAKHVIDISAGPRREGWFNAEAFVALSHKANIDSFVIYGEQNYSTILRGTALLADAADAQRLPDLIGFALDKGQYAIDFVIEGKVILRSDAVARRMKALWELRDQVERAKRCCGSCAVVGICYLISNDGASVEPEPFYKSVGNDLEAILDSLNWRWLREPSALNGLRLRTTSFDYPQMTISVGAAAFVL